LYGGKSLIPAGVKKSVSSANWLSSRLFNVFPSSFKLISFNLSFNSISLVISFPNKLVAITKTALKAAINVIADCNFG